MAESRVITDLITGSCGSAAAPVRFPYNPADPCAILLDLTDLARACEQVNGEAPEDDERTWTFARSLLTDALVADGPSGLHDVVIERDGIYLVFALTSPDGTARVRVLRQALMRFAHRTLMLVPLGGESDYLDVDAAIAALLGGVS